MAGLPLLKLSALLVKTISKPVAAFMKAQAQKEKRLADIFCHMGQSLHYVSSRINVIASGYKFVGVKPLPADQALNDGVGVFSEMLVLSISATLVVYEYERSANKEIIKNEKLSAEKAHQRYLTEARFQGIENRLHRIEQLLEKSQGDVTHGEASERGTDGNKTGVSGQSWWGLGAWLLGGPKSSGTSKDGTVLGAAPSIGDAKGRGEEGKEESGLPPKRPPFSTPESSN